MPSFPRRYTLRFVPQLKTLLLIMGLASVLVVLPQGVRSESISAQLDQASSLAATNPREGLNLAKQIAKLAQQANDVLSEVQARSLIVGILRAETDQFELTLYREQLNRLDILVQQEEEEVRSKDRALLSILQAELALYLADNVEAVRLARVAVQQSEHLEGAGLNGVAQLALGVALTRGYLFGFLDDAKVYQQVSGLIDPKAFDEPFVLLIQGFGGKWLENYPFLVLEGKKSLAFIYGQRLEYEKQLALYGEIAPPDSAPPLVRAHHLINVATAELNLKKQKEAEDHLQIVWDLLHADTSGNDPKVRANALIGSFDGFYAAGQIERAQVAFREGADILGEDSDGRRNLLSSVERYLLPALEGRNESRLGAEILEQMLSIPGIGDEPGTALPLLAKLGRFYARLLDYRKFAQVSEKSRTLHAKAPNWKAFQELLIQEATMRRFQDPNGTAVAYRYAIAAAGQSNDGHIDYELVFYGFRHATMLAMAIGRYQDALDIALMGLTYLKNSRKDDPSEAIMEFLIETSRAMTKLGRFDLAEDALSLAMGLRPNVRADWNQRIRLAASEFYSLIGDTESSLLHLNLVDKFSMAEHIAPSAPILMRQRAGVLKQLGNYLAAEDALHSCISIATASVVRRPDAEMWCRWDLSKLLWESLLEFEEGGDEYIKALKLAGDQKDIFAMVEMHIYSIWRGLLHGYQDLNQAIEQSRGTIETLQPLPTTVRVDIYRTVSYLLVLFAQKKMGAQKLDWGPFDESLHAVMTEPYISTGEYEFLVLVGLSLKAMGENERALSVLEEVVTRIEYVRSLLTDPRLQIRLGSAVNQLFDEIVGVYLDQKGPQGIVNALQTAEANRARSIHHFEEIGQRISDADDSHGTIREQARSKLERLRRINGNALTSEEIQAATHLFSTALSQNEVLPRDQRTGEKPSTMSQRRSMPSLNLDKVRANLSLNAAVIMYHLTGRLAGAWVITSEGLQWIELGDPNTVKAGILHYRTELLSGEPGAEQRLGRAATAAFDLLLGPLITAIEGKTHLIIIPDASAFLIPFEALAISTGPDTGKYVIERYSVTYHMSLGRLRGSAKPSTHQTGKTRTVLLVGNPALPSTVPPSAPQERAELVPLAGAQREIERIREIVGRLSLSVYTGDEARKDRFQEQLRHTTVAHFATHGVLNERYPWASYLALAGENGHLLLDELPRMPLVADLVVLSACETGRGRILGGEGVWGFQSQFLSAGAKNVVGTLWRVEDESTAEFMEEFYGKMGPELTDYPHALRAAKLKLLHSEKWHHPYYWAPFVLYGEAPPSE